MFKLFKPRKNLIVRDPYTMAIIPENGVAVDMNSSHSKYYRRRVKCGDGTFEDYVEKKIESVEEKETTDEKEYTFKKRRK